MWDVTGGLRWSRDEKDAFISHTNSPGNGFAVNALLFPPTQPGDRDRSGKVTWSFNTRYDLTDDVMLFLPAPRLQIRWIQLPQGTGWVRDRI